MLQFLLDDNIIDFTHVQEQIAMKKRKELLEKHPYKIWKGKDDFWHTYLPNGSERKPVKKAVSVDEHLYGERTGTAGTKYDLRCSSCSGL